jgi:hypothetical protein
MLRNAGEIERKPTKGRNWSDSTQRISKDVWKNPLWEQSFVDYAACNFPGAISLVSRPGSVPFVPVRLSQTPLFGAISDFFAVLCLDLNYEDAVELTSLASFSNVLND